MCFGNISESIKQIIWKSMGKYRNFSENIAKIRRITTMLVAFWQIGTDIAVGWSCCIRYISFIIGKDEFRQFMLCHAIPESVGISGTRGVGVIAFAKRKPKCVETRSYVQG